MEVNVDLGSLPVEAVLLVADVLDGVAGELDHLVRGDGFGPAHLTGDDDPVGGGERLAGDPRLRLGRQVSVDHGIRYPIADLIRMSLRNRLTREKIARTPHG
jgi:hypothetical protein